MTLELIRKPWSEDYEMMEDGQLFTEKIVRGVGLKKITVGTEAPENPEVGDLWIDTTGL